MNQELSQALRDAIIQLWDWQHGGTSFYCGLYRLWNHADHWNKQRLAVAFPFHAEALRMWETAGNYGNDLFKQIGIKGEWGAEQEMVTAVNFEETES